MQNRRKPFTAMPWITAALFLSLVFPPASAQAAIPSAQKEEPGVDLLCGVKVPMRDGVLLNATVYKPAGMQKPLPVIVSLTPYIADTYHPRAMYFARGGYVFASVDVRGRGNSGGVFDPNRQEARDGCDVVEWASRQPFCDGQVAMWGGSYGGDAQWATLGQFPPHLKTIVPVAAAYASVDFPFWKNVWNPYCVQWFALVAGVTGNEKLHGDPSFWIQKYRQLYLSHLPFKELDSLSGCPSPRFQEWLAHPIPGPFWDAMVPSDESLARVDIPVLTITGHYDDDQPGAMEYYTRHMRLAPAAAREKHFLVMGPWDHSGTRTPRREVGGIAFGEASLLDMNALHKAWYDWVLKGGPRPGFLEKRVAYYVAGEEVWKYADSLETIPAKIRSLYLNSTGDGAKDVFHSGTLGEERPAAQAPDRYIYDPLDVRPAELERELTENWITDQRPALNLFGNGLVYHTRPFEEPVEITGKVRLTAWIALDVPDTDFRATLYEIASDGTSVKLTFDLVRARHRESPRTEVTVRPGEILPYVFDGFPWFSRRIAKGSRLRLVLDCPNSIYLQKNYNSGGNVAEESGKDARTAHVVLYHDPKHPSALEIPVVGGAPAR